MVQQAMVLSVMKVLSNFRAGVPLDSERIRQWSYLFRDHMGEDRRSILASMIVDDAEVEAEEVEAE